MDREEFVLHAQLGWLLALEIGLLVGLFVVLTASLLGTMAVLSTFSRPVRVAALAFVTVELLIPSWVYYDVRRRPDLPGTIWLHAASMPVVNVLGLFAYLEARNRSEGE